jgi:hypothetical protein
MTQVNILREYLTPPAPPFPRKDLFLIIGVWFLVMGAAGILFFLR